MSRQARDISLQGPRRILIVVLLIVVVAELAGGAILYRTQEASLRERAEQELTAIGRVKATQVETWRAERLADGQRITRAPGIHVAFAAWEEDPSPAKSRMLLERLESLRNVDRYVQTRLVDLTGEVVLETTGTPGPLSSATLHAVDEAAHGGSAALSEVYEAPDGGVCLDVACPLLVGEGSQAQPVAYVILRADLRNALLPQLQSWPVPSDTAEVHLVVRDGDDALFISGVPALDLAEFRLRIPLDDDHVIAARAVRGETGIVEGVDYGDVPTLAYVHDIPDSPWLLVAEVDRDEAFAAWRERSVFVLGVVILLAMVLVGAVIVAWQGVRTARVTELLEAEGALRAAEEQFRGLVEGAPDAIFVQADQRFAYANGCAVRLYGASSVDDLIGRPVADCIHPDYRGDLLEEMDSMSECGERGAPREQVHRTLRGEDLHVEVSVAPIQYHGQNASVVFVRDITLRIEAAQELERYRDHLEELVGARTREIEAVNAELTRANAVKSTFLANMSHELRTPLNSIIGFSTMLFSGIVGPLSEEQTTQIGMINASGKHLLSVIESILDISRIEAGRVEVRVEEFDPATVLDDAADILRPLAAEKGLELHVHSVGAPSRIRSDPGKVRQILLNLGGNAVKFTGAGAVGLSVAPGPGDTVIFTVRDTGPGIRGDLLPAIFDSFTQGDTLDGQAPHGTGLGLAISREYARLLGGDITVESELGAGSVFELTLPSVLSTGEAES